MQHYKEYRKDPVSGRWVKRTASEMRKLSKRPKSKVKPVKAHTETPTVKHTDPSLDRELVTEYLKLDPESPTGLVWAINNHDKPWLVSFKEAGSVAGNLRDNRVNICGSRIETLRAVYMLQHGTAIGSVSPLDGKPLHFIRSKATGLVYHIDDKSYKERVYGGQRGRRKVS